MTIEAFNDLTREEKGLMLQQCCGSKTWIEKMISERVVSVDDLFDKAEKKWYQCSEEDWKEAFRHHPKIGDIDSLRKKFFADPFAGKEQVSVRAASKKILEDLAEGNRLYEQKFGFIFIVCASGKSAPEMLYLLNTRLQNSTAEEIKMAMEEQAKITRLRLKKLFDV